MNTDYKMGCLYFMVSYEDKDLTIPAIDPVVFIGKNLNEDNDERWYFQDAESFSMFGSYPNMSNPDNKNGKAQIYSLRDVDLCHVKDPQGIADELNECLMRWEIGVKSSLDS